MSARAQLAVIGGGYVGLATAIGLASRGHEVEIVEVREDRREALLSGRLPIHEPGMDAALALPDVRARISVGAEIRTRPDVILVCVGTPLQDGGRCDVRQLESALDAIRPLVRAGVPAVIRSTLPPGTLSRVLARTGDDPSRIFVNPEFLRQGTAFEDFQAPTRVVIGAFAGRDEAALAAVVDLLAVAGSPLIVVGVTAAELIKNGANAFLALKLSFANEMAVLCEELDADVGEVIAGIGMDPRIGHEFMQPSFGFGGSCLPKELRTLTNVGRGLGLQMHVTSAAAEANDAHQIRFIRLVREELGSGGRVAVLGLAFKAGTDDVRYSPGLRIAQALLDDGIDVVAFDPQASRNAAHALPTLCIAKSAGAALDDASVAVIATEWPEFRDLDWDRLGSRMRARVVVDGRRLLDRNELERAGFRYRRLGAPRPPAVPPRARPGEEAREVLPAAPGTAAPGLAPALGG